jgi:hypothetical protein
VLQLPSKWSTQVSTQAVMVVILSGNWRRLEPQTPAGERNREHHHIRGINLTDDDLEYVRLLGRLPSLWLKFDHRDISQVVSDPLLVIANRTTVMSAHIFEDAPRQPAGAGSLGA